MTNYPNPFAAQRDYTLTTQALDNVNRGAFASAALNNNGNTMHTFQNDALVNDPQWGMVFPDSYNWLIVQQPILTPALMVEFQRGDYRNITATYEAQLIGAINVTHRAYYKITHKKFLFFRYRSDKFRIGMIPMGVPRTIKTRRLK